MARRPLSQSVAIFGWLFGPRGKRAVHMIRPHVAAYALAVLAGCATTKIPFRDVSMPPLNQKATAHLGESLLFQARGYYTDVVSVSELRGKFAIIGAGDYCRLPGGDDYFNFNGRAIVYLNFVGGVRSYDDTLTYKEKKNEVCLDDIWSGCFDTSFGSIVHKHNALCSDPNAYQQAIEYNGKAGNVLNFTYREFYGDRMRPPYTTNFTMDELEGDVVAYKAARLKVLSATNQSIEYTVLRNFTGGEEP